MKKLFPGSKLSQPCNEFQKETSRFTTNLVKLLISSNASSSHITGKIFWGSHWTNFLLIWKFAMKRCYQFVLNNWIYFRRQLIYSRPLACRPTLINKTELGTWNGSMNPEATTRPFSTFLPLWTKYSSTGPVQAPSNVPHSLTPTEELPPVASEAQSHAQSPSQCTRKLLPRWGNRGKRMEASNPTSVPQPVWHASEKRDSRKLTARLATLVMSCSEQRSAAGLRHTQNPRGRPSSPEKVASAPGGLCTTGLQDSDVRTMAAIISSISTASDFLDSSEQWPKVTSWHGWSHHHLTSGLSLPHTQLQSASMYIKAWRSLFILHEK